MVQTSQEKYMRLNPRIQLTLQHFPLVPQGRIYACRYST